MTKKSEGWQVESVPKKEGFEGPVASGSFDVGEYYVRNCTAYPARHFFLCLRAVEAHNKEVAMKQALMFLALNFALAAPVEAVAFALIADTTAIVEVHPQQALAKLHHFALLSARPAIPDRS